MLNVLDLFCGSSSQHPTLNGSRTCGPRSNESLSVIFECPRLQRPAPLYILQVLHFYLFCKGISKKASKPEPTMHKLPHPFVLHESMGWPSSKSLCLSLTMSGSYEPRACTKIKTAFRSQARTGARVRSSSTLTEAALPQHWRT